MIRSSLVALAASVASLMPPLVPTSRPWLGNRDGGDLADLAARRRRQAQTHRGKRWRGAIA